MPVTQKDIARALNVSVMAVHRALNNSGYVSKRLKERVLQYASDVNYRPHRVAQALVRRRIRRLALFSVDTPDFFWNDVQAGIETALGQIQAFGYEVRYRRIPAPDTEVYLRAIDEAVKSGVDAVGLVNNYEFDMQRIFSRLENSKIPYLTFNVDAEGSRRHCFIGPDYALEGRLAADFLGKVLTGKGSVAVLYSSVHRGDWRKHPREISSQRLEGFVAFLQEEHPRLRWHVHYVDQVRSPQEIRRGVSRLLKSSAGKLDAVFCIPHYSSIVGRCVQECGLAKKIALVTFDLSSELKQLIKGNVVTASICQKPIQQGYYAVKMLEFLLETESIPRGTRFFISPHVVVKANVDVEDDLFAIRSLQAQAGRAITERP